MKKKYLFSLVVVAIMSLTFYNVFQNKADIYLSDLALENIEALAQSEINPDCSNGCLTTSGFCYCYGWNFYKPGKW